MRGSGGGGERAGDRGQARCSKGRRDQETNADREEEPKGKDAGDGGRGVSGPAKQIWKARSADASRACPSSRSSNGRARLQEATTGDGRWLTVDDDHDDTRPPSPTPLHAASPPQQPTQWPCARPSDGHWATPCARPPARAPRCRCAPLQPPRCGRRRWPATARTSRTCAYVHCNKPRPWACPRDAAAAADRPASTPPASPRLPSKRPPS